jgi:hypothetical protein
MTPVIAPREPPDGASVTDDLAALMPPSTPPIALFRVLAHNPASSRVLAPDVCSTPEHCRRANASC